MVTEAWVTALKVRDVPENGMLVLNIGGHELLFSRHAEAVSCFKNACGHLGYPLDMGQVMHGAVTCPFHKHRFCLRTGQCLNMPGEALTALPLRIVENEVQVQLPDKVDDDAE